MILGTGEKLCGFAVAKRVQRNLDALEKFLDDDLIPGTAKDLRNEDFIDRAICLRNVLAKQHPFSKRKAIGFDDTVAA